MQSLNELGSMVPVHIKPPGSVATQSSLCPSLNLKVAQPGAVQLPGPPGYWAVIVPILLPFTETVTGLAGLITDM